MPPVSKLTHFAAQHLGVPAGDLELSKFYHGTPRGNTKVLFLVSDGRRVRGVVKIVRESVYNKKLAREHEGQMHAAAAIKILRTPEVYGAGVIDGYFVYFEEAVLGRGPIGKRRAPLFVRAVHAYQEEILKEKRVSADRLVSLFQTAEGVAEDYDALLHKLRSLGAGEVFTAWSHGDVTYMNLVEGERGLYLIDWEEYNTRPIWGVDFVHYAIRCFGTADVNLFAAALSELSVPVDPEYMQRAFLIDRLCDALAKRHPEHFARMSSALHTL